MIGKLRLLFWLGIVMLFLPFFGISNTLKMILAVIIGVTLIILAVVLRRKYRSLRSVIRNLEQTVSAPALQDPEPPVSHTLIHE